MPNARVYKKPKRRYNKRAYGRAKWSRYGAHYGSKVGSMAYSALKMAKQVKRLVNVESKFYDINSAGTCDYNGVIVPLCIPAQGITDGTRVGDSIKCQHLSMRLHVFANTSAASTVRSIVRCIIFEDKQNKVSAGGDLLQIFGTGQGVLSPKYWDNRFETKVLYDKTWTLDNINQTGRHESIELPLGHHSQFEAGTTAINTGSYKMLYFSNHVATDLPTFNYVSRVTYTDD